MRPTTTFARAIACGVVLLAFPACSDPETTGPTRAEVVEGISAADQGDQLTTEQEECVADVLLDSSSVFTPVTVAAGLVCGPEKIGATTCGGNGAVGRIENTKHCVPPGGMSAGTSSPPVIRFVAQSVVR